MERQTMDPTGGEPKAPRLLDRVRTAIRTRHYSRRTERAYVGWIRRYVLFHGKKHPAELGAAQIETFLNHLAVRDKVSAFTQNQALCAIVLLYRHVLRMDFDMMGCAPGLCGVPISAACAAG